MNERGKKLNFEGVKDKISLKNVSFCGIEGGESLNKVNLEISRGSTVGIFGPGRSGKSIIGQILAWACSSSEGEVMIDDLNLNNLHFQQY